MGAGHRRRGWGTVGHRGTVAWGGGQPMRPEVGRTADRTWGDDHGLWLGLLLLLLLRSHHGGSRVVIVVHADLAEDNHPATSLQPNGPCDD